MRFEKRTRLQWGLSPRVRGKLLRSAAWHAAHGPIPASAGETWAATAPKHTARAYPRECGGNQQLGRAPNEMEGLSPRVRGKRCFYSRFGVLGGPIPASAGETRFRAWKATAHGAYPRECGGNVRLLAGIVVVQGLSPRVRGKQAAGYHAPEQIGPIPASAGETRCFQSLFWKAWAYPRECGGNVPYEPTLPVNTGLSPRVRGKRSGPQRHERDLGPIPASAGETSFTCAGSLLQRAYPRECGGNSMTCWSASWTLGLSPRVRGKQGRR